MLMHALGRIEDGLTNGLVVSTLDRFGRSLLDGLAMIERIRAAGGIFVAVEDGFDLDTDTGQLVLRIMLAIAEWELSRNRAQWAIARERANARGIHIGRCAPYGYVHTPERRLTPDVGLVQFIVAVFRQRSEGASLTELASYLTNCDAPPSGRRWRAAAVQRLISNRVYLGELRDGLYVNPKAHPALVNRPVWNAAQRSGRMTVGRRKRRLPTVLGGLLRCAGCRLVLSSRTIVDATGSARRVYGCNDESPFGACPSRAWIKSREIEPYVDALFFQLLQAVDHRLQTQSRLCELNADLEAARADTRRYRDGSRRPTAFAIDRLAPGLARRVEREQRLRLAIDAERARLGAIGRCSAKEREDAWSSMSVIERRQLMGQAIEAVFVARGAGTVHDRTFVCPRGGVPIDLPTRGPNRGRMTRFDPKAHRTVVYTRPATEPCWSDARIRHELTQFLSARNRQPWPAADEFVYAGRGPLLRQVDATGGRLYWASQL